MVSYSRHTLAGCRLLLAFWIAAASPTAAAQYTWEVSVDAVVTDAAGRPIAGAELCDWWRCTPEGMFPGRDQNDGRDVLVSDGNGRIRGTWHAGPFEIPLLALSPDRSRAAYVRSRKRASDGHIVVDGAIVLSEAVRALHFRLQGRANLEVTGLRHDSQSQVHDGYLLMGSASAGEIVLTLPTEGAARMKLGLRTRLAERAWTLTIPSAASSMDLGDLTIPYSPLERVGEFAPDWTVNAARNVSADRAQPCDFRGQPLLVLFRAPAGPHNRPERQAELLKAIRNHPRAADFQMLILHLEPAAAGAEPAETDADRGFPVVTDWSGQTVATYGPIYGGELLLLGSDGRLVDLGHVAAFERTLAELAQVLDPSRSAPK